MRKYLSWFCFLIILGLAISCEKESYNYGDKNLLSSLSIVSVTDSVGGYNYDYENPECSDTTYVYYYIDRDTTYTDDGGIDEIIKDTVYYNGMTAKLYTLPVIVLPSYKNRLYIELESNARWNVPAISFKSGQDWIFNSKVTGIGDAIIDYRVGARTYGLPDNLVDIVTIPIRRDTVTQYLTTSDSTVMYKLQFTQKSMTEE